MTIYWSSTKAPRDVLTRRKYETPEIEAYVRANIGVCPSLLAVELGMHEQQVMAYQRRIGVRQLTGNGK